MAYSDIQNKVGQIQMANQILLAQSKIPPPNEGEGTRDYRKRISGGSYKNKPNPKNPYAGMTDEQQKEAADKNQEKLNKKREEERLDQDPELNKQREDMRQGDYLQDPEQPFNINTLLQIGGKALDLLKFVPQMMIRPNAVAMDMKDAIPRGGFFGLEKTNVIVNDGGEAFIVEPDGNFKFDGFYDPVRHGPMFPGYVQNQSNDDMKIAKLPHSPPVELLPIKDAKGNFIPSPLRFKTDQQRIKFMEDFSRGYGRYS